MATDVKVVYAVIGGYASMGSLTYVLGHEIVESQTNPDPQGKYGPQAFRAFQEADDYGEVSDLCQTPTATYPDGLYMQGYYSNSDKNCVTPHLLEDDQGSDKKVGDRGGRVLKNPKLYMIFWGTDWRDRTANPTRAAVISKVRDSMLVTNREYFSKLSQYRGVGVPVWGDAILNLTTDHPGSSIGKYDEPEAMISDTFNSGTLPQPSESEEVVYIVMLPIGTMIEPVGQVGGYHNIFKHTVGSVGGTPTNDPKSIKMIYPTKTAGETWFMDENNLDHDSRFRLGGKVNSITRNSDGSWSCDNNSQVRLNIVTSAGYNQNNVERDHSKCSDQGYMMNAKDWRNIEFTAYFMLEDSSTEDQFVLYCRGGTHTGNNEAPGVGCEGVAYKCDLFFGGDVRFAKEQWHVSYVFQNTKSTGLKSIKGRWVGMKFIVYNELKAGKNIVHLEQWIDDKADKQNWVMINSMVDSGGWGTKGGQCGGNKDQIVDWGGPFATMRWDNVNDARFKWVSVREINVGSTFPEQPPQDPTGIVRTIRCPYNVGFFTSPHCQGG